MTRKAALYDSYASKELSLSSLLHIFKLHGVRKVIYKKLSPNDNSKNQPYMGGHLTDLGFLPIGEITESRSTSNKTTNLKRKIKYTASLKYYWLSAENVLYIAPEAKLIYYPQYPEVRLSGFVSKCDFDMGGWMDPEKKGRQQGRVLFFGIMNSGEILAYLAVPGSRISREVDDYRYIELTGIFKELLLQEKVPIKSPNKVAERNEIKYQSDLFEGLDDKYEASSRVSSSTDKHEVTIDTDSRVISSKSLLLDQLKRIHLLNWIESKRLNKDGLANKYTAQNGGGYTLEAELGITPNGYADPDYMGWEIKQFGVSRCDLINSKPLTLMTPEPDGGFYAEYGAEAFMRKYGYKSPTINDRMDFTGRHFSGEVCDKSGLVLVTQGYDIEKNMITDAAGCIALLDKNGNSASSWAFSKLMEHWKRKHAKAAYIPSISRKDADSNKSYNYCKNIRLFEGTTFLRLLEAFAESQIYYDPGIKLENVSTKPKTKRRSQFRIKSRQLYHLYEKRIDVDVLKNNQEIVCKRDKKRK